jgi:nitroreductase
MKLGLPTMTSVEENSVYENTLPGSEHRAHRTRRGAVPAQVIDAMLAAGIAAYQKRKFKPWRFLVVRDRARLAALQRAMGDVGDLRLSGNAVIAIFTSPALWKRSAAALLPDWAKDQRLVSRMLHSLSETEVLGQQLRQLCTFMDLAARALGWEAVAHLGPPDRAVRRELGLKGMEVAGLLEIRPHGEARAGREELAELAFAECLEQPWTYSGSVPLHA